MIRVGTCQPITLRWLVTGRHLASVVQGFELTSGQELGSSSHLFRLTIAHPCSASRESVPEAWVIEIAGGIIQALSYMDEWACHRTGGHLALGTYREYKHGSIQQLHDPGSARFQN